MKKTPYVPFEEAIKRFTPEELSWDFHCNGDGSDKHILVAEARSRGVDLCRVRQRRHGGPFVPGAQYERPACGKNCMNKY